MWQWIFVSRRGRRLWGAAWGALLVLTLFLALWPLTAPVASTGWDKSDHLLGFAALATTGMWMLPVRARAQAGLLLGLILFGGLIEVLQTFIPHRQGDVWDWLADAIGVGLGAVVGYAVLRWVGVHCAATSHSDPPGPHSP